MLLSLILLKMTTLNVASRNLCFSCVFYVSSCQEPPCADQFVITYKTASESRARDEISLTSELIPSPATPQQTYYWAVRRRLFRKGYVCQFYTVSARAVSTSFVFLWLLSLNCFIGLGWFVTFLNNFFSFFKIGIVVFWKLFSCIAIYYIWENIILSVK